MTSDMDKAGNQSKTAETYHGMFCVGNVLSIA